MEFAIFRFGGIVSLEFLKISRDVLFQQISTTLSTVGTSSLHIVDSVDSLNYCRLCVDSFTDCRQCT